MKTPPDFPDWRTAEAIDFVDFYLHYIETLPWWALIRRHKAHRWLVRWIKVAVALSTRGEA